MEASRSWNLGCPALHVIDREADSVDISAHGVRRDITSWCVVTITVSSIGKDAQWQRHDISRELQNRGGFRHCGEAEYHGSTAQLWVAEAEVVLDQPARTMVPVRKGAKKKKQVTIPGPALTLRLIIVQVRDDDGRVLATWYLRATLRQEWLLLNNWPGVTIGGGASKAISNFSSRTDNNWKAGCKKLERRSSEDC